MTGASLRGRGAGEELALRIRSHQAGLRPAPGLALLIAGTDRFANRGRALGHIQTMIDRARADKAFQIIILGHGGRSQGQGAKSAEQEDMDRCGLHGGEA